ncbi:hypothetical protein NQ176_g8242 [Zarea fungicola]|uniref:Uncharacterized protein n=1 Tax=Zarea fungicola TaxID=93591 RepID=A0ACC1MVQ5_9HYPO|nr:hypothetical protein NQ176_g8242 [Lecanicillium fungicola]
MVGLFGKRSRPNSGSGSDYSTAKRVKLNSFGHLKEENAPAYSADPEPTADTGLESAAPKMEQLESKILKQSDDPKLIAAPRHEPLAATMENESGSLLEPPPLLYHDTEPNDMLGSELPAAKAEEPEPICKPEPLEHAVMEATEGAGSAAPETENIEPNNDPQRITWYRYFWGYRLLARQRNQLEPGNSPARADALELRTVTQRGAGHGSSAMPEPSASPVPPKPSSPPAPEMIPLSETALKRLDKQPAPQAQLPEVPRPTDIARFARNGGPNLRLITMVRK